LMDFWDTSRFMKLMLGVDRLIWISNVGKCKSLNTYAKKIFLTFSFVVIFILSWKNNFLWLRKERKFLIREILICDVWAPFSKLFKNFTFTKFYNFHFTKKNFYFLIILLYFLIIFSIAIF
jgi:hypothetical protein